ncbi:nephrin-like isoform X2 [Varroa jacobsoni]|uniref:Ig-like domain-containing protein n=1 Tax=Varroa destructor TaxID=109461 RepID=A0A7M7KFB9_VARDE|nr:nephrin-like isoform X2 [Varroa destructor]XP_022689854.1 nephrin-like isoform X2 [Varroa jacobsoni]
MMTTKIAYFILWLWLTGTMSSAPVVAKVNHRSHRHAIIQPPADKLKPFASIVYWAVVRGKVALPCNIEPPAAGDEVVLVLWYKDDSPAPVFTLDARRGDLERARHIDRTAQSDQLASRAYFNMANKPAFLQLDPVQEEDAGEFRCRVDFKRSRSINTVISLRVVVPPGEPVILDGTGKRLQGPIGPFNEGDPLKLTCQAEYGKPRPAVTWWKDFRMIDDSYTFVQSENVVKNVLEIEALTRSDALTGFTCKAANNNVTVAVSTSVIIDLNLKPQEVTIQPAERPISANKPFELTCTSTGSRPPAMLSWWRGDQQVRAGVVERSSGSADAQSVLTFTPTIDDHGRIIACRAENKVIPGSALEQAWKLDIHHPPRVSVSLGASIVEDEIEEGKDVVLDCKVIANPYSSQVGWIFQGRELLANQSAGIVISSQSLVMQRVSVRQQGTYSCYAKNKEGKGVSNEYVLNIKFAPMCAATQRFTYGISRQEPVAVNCFVDSDPAEVSFRWAFNSSEGVVKDISEGFSNTSGGRSTLLYKPLLDDDFGSLLCWAQNSVGAQREPCVFSLITAGPPDAVHNCSQINTTEDGMTIECAPGPWDGGLSNPLFTAEVYETVEGSSSTKLPPVVNISTLGVPVFVIRSVANGQSFRVVIYASNAKGSSPPFVLMAQTPRPAERYTADVSALMAFRPVVGIALGVAAALLIATGILVTVYRCRLPQQHGNDKHNLSHGSLADKDSTGGYGETDIPLGSPEKPLTLVNGGPASSRMEDELEKASPDVIPMSGPLAPGASLAVTLGAARSSQSQSRQGDFVDLESSSAVPVDSPYQHLNVIGGLSDGIKVPDPICRSTPPLGPARPSSVKSLERVVSGASVMPLALAAAGEPGFSELVLATNVMLPSCGDMSTLIRQRPGATGSGGTLRRANNGIGGVPTEYARIDFHRSLRPAPGGHLLAAEDHSAYPIVGDIEPSLALETAVTTASSGIESTV